MSKFDQKFANIKIADLEKMADARFNDGWRFVQILAVRDNKHTDLIYSFMKDGFLENLKIKSVKETDNIPSISNKFLEAFVFENEIHDLFNINISNIAIDFKGKFYNTAQDAPMTIIDAATIARKEKQAKIDKALATKAKAAKASKQDEGKDK